MKGTIKIFKSFEEQEEYSLELMARSTPEQRLRKLYELQKMTQILHPPGDKKIRKIVIKKWIS